MLMDMRNALMAGGGGLSAKSYVQDGLIAMWDGIENAGWGVHDPNATVWADLSGSSHNLNATSASWQTNALASGKFMLGSTLNYLQIEICAFNIRVTDVFFNKSMYTRLCYFNNTLYWGGAYPTARYYRNLVTADRHFTIGATYANGSDDNVSSLSANGAILPLSTWGASSTATSANLFINPTSNALVYCVRLYSRALTAAEISANYAIDKARFNLPDAT